MYKLHSNRTLPKLGLTTGPQLRSGNYLMHSRWKDVLGVAGPPNATQPEGNWETLMNHYCYARTHGYKVFFWFGDAKGPDLQEMLQARDPKAVRCEEPRPPSNHSLRAVALRTILEERPTLKGIEP